jgi:hypothetical protein
MQFVKTSSGNVTNQVKLLCEKTYLVTEQFNLITCAPFALTMSFFLNLQCFLLHLISLFFSSGHGMLHGILSPGKGSKKLTLMRFPNARLDTSSMRITWT